MFYDAYGERIFEFSRCGSPLPTWIACVGYILFLVPLFACQAYFGCIDDDYMVATVYMRCKVWFVFTPNHRGYLAGQPAKGLTFGIDKQPCFTDALRFGRSGFIA